MPSRQQATGERRAATAPGATPVPGALSAWQCHNCERDNYLSELSTLVGSLWQAAVLLPRLWICFQSTFCDSFSNSSIDLLVFINK